ncbi:oligosaccharide flippase family protein [Pseudarthrobacter sp. NIBRBAC000502771]|uniref:oligosaccharide flippase family protein n=1 Tax=Pseudarthrobacter sp. NIBRBAC000502771 TaxID=2590774 RepID=UPI00113284F7|nr:oligosaccharide flippase family protein [Pseudarthrobacter sp. NIBRBAC000502771]QDG61809.1 hypothetical protein NIBR502771_05430 [Pseudarthrobacter sp. NIBRBAC000502771]
MTTESDHRSAWKNSLPLVTANSGREARLAASVKRGAGWSAGGTIFLRLSNILLTAIVARIVSPEALGVFTLAVTVHSIVVTLAELGVASAVSRCDLDVDKIAPTITTLAIVGSLLLAIPMAAFASQIAQFMGNEDAASSIKILSIGVALIGPLAVPGALLQRNFRQKVNFWASVASFVPGSATLLVLATLGDGAEAYAWSRIVGQIVMGGIILAYSSRIYLPGLEFPLLRPLLAFGLPLAGANLLSQILLNLDYALIGRLLTVADLGVYFLAFNVAMWPTAIVGTVLNSIVLPAFSRVLRDNGNIRKSITDGLTVIALIVFPIGAFLLAFSDQLIVIVYGPKWAAAGPVLSILATYGVLFVFGLFIANILIALGKTSLLFVGQVGALLALVPALWIGITLAGLHGAGVAHIVVMCGVTIPVYFWGLRRATSIGLGELCVALKTPVLSSIFAAVLAKTLTLPLPDGWLSVLLGGVIGLGTCIAMNYRVLTQLIPMTSRRVSQASQKRKSPTAGRDHP